MEGKRIVLATSGSRGDVQPMVALALRLREAGHAVKLCAPPNFKGWADSEFLRTLPPEVLEDPWSLLDFPGGEIVKQDPDTVARLTIDGKTLWVKRYRGGLRRRLSSFFGQTPKAMHCWNTAQALLAEGIETARPLLGLVGRPRWALVKVTERLARRSKLGVEMPG